MPYPDDLKPRRYEYNILRTLEFNPEGFIFEKRDFNKMYMEKTAFYDYRKKLENNGYIQKINTPRENRQGEIGRKKTYFITDKGIQRLKDLKSIRKDIQFPPNNLELNNEERILWMLANNTFCRARDFKNRNCGIRSSSFYSNVDRLLNRQYIVRDNISEISHSVYKITDKGREKYLSILKEKGRDPKIIHEEKINILSKMNQSNQIFFNKYNIEKSNIRYRFNNYKIIFSYSSYKDIFGNNENNYNLFLLYLVLNHPDNYPICINEENFCKKYGLDIVNLKYYIHQIFKEAKSIIKIFRIKIEEGNCIYYFHEKDLIYKMMKIIIEEYFESKFIRMLDLKSKKSVDKKVSNIYNRNYFSINDEDLYDIASQICENYSILDNNFQYILTEFLEDFIKHLEYKFEEEYESFDRYRYNQKSVTSFDIYNMFSKMEEISQKPVKKINITEDKSTNILYEIIDDKKLNFLNHILKRTETLTSEHNFREALKTINTGLDEIKKIDLQLRNEEDGKLNNNYYYFRIQFFSKKVDILFELKEFNKIASLMKDIDSITLIDVIVSRLIDIEEISYAKKVFDNVFSDPPENISKEDLDEFYSECYFQIEANFHNEILDLYRNNENERAIMIADKFLKFNPHAKDILKIKAFALAELKKYREALEVINKAIKLSPKGLRILGKNWLEEFSEEKKSKKRIKSYEDSNYQYDYYISKIRLLMKMQNYKESKTLLNRIINLNPRVSEAHFLLSIINAYVDNNYKQALVYVENAIKHSNGINHKYHGQKANYLLTLNRPKEALETINQFEQKYSMDLKEFLSTKCEALERVGKYKEALIVVNDLIKKNNKKPWNYYKKAFILNKMGENSEALKNINKALKIKPKKFVYLQDKIGILEDLGRIDDALKLIDIEESVLTSHANQFRAQLYPKKAIQLANSGNKKEAIDTIEKSIKIDPEEANYFNTYGEIYMKFEEYKKAIEKLEIAIKLHFTPTEAYINLGICYYQIKNYENALEFLRRGRNLATHSFDRLKKNKNIKLTQEDYLQEELIKEADNYILKIQKVIEK